MPAHIPAGQQACPWGTACPAPAVQLPPISHNVRLPSCKTNVHGLLRAHCYAWTLQPRTRAQLHNSSRGTPSSAGAFRAIRAPPAPAAKVSASEDDANAPGDHFLRSKRDAPETEAAEVSALTRPDKLHSVYRKPVNWLAAALWLVQIYAVLTDEAGINVLLEGVGFSFRTSDGDFLGGFSNTSDHWLLEVSRSYCTPCQ